MAEKNIGGAPRPPLPASIHRRFAERHFSFAVVNFPPKKMGPEVMGPEVSEVLILGVPDAEGKVIRLMPERAVAPGVKVF